MAEIRVESLDDIDVPEQGVIYIVEPGTSSWLWNGSGFVQHESRAPTIQYGKVFKDLQTETEPEPEPDVEEVIITPPEP